MADGVSIRKAQLYERHRLPYAPEAVDALLQSVALPGAVAVAGAGTGPLARLFADRCRRVFAVEPDAAMRAVAQEALVDLPAVTVVAGWAERTTKEPEGKRESR